EPTVTVERRFRAASSRARAPGPSLLRRASREMLGGGERRIEIGDTDLARLEVGHLARSEARIACTERIRREVRREALINDRLLRELLDEVLFALEVEERRPVGVRHVGGGIDRETALGRAIAASFVEVLEAEADRIEEVVTPGAAAGHEVLMLVAFARRDDARLR